MVVHYEPTEDLYSIAQAAVDECAAGPVTNLLLAYELDAGVVESEFVEAYRGEALEWMTFTPPEHLPFTHGQYYRGDEGLEYVRAQLRRNGSRRALLSLVGMQQILDAQPDGPLPSFLILQFAIDENVLTLTSYFRALEISSFFRSNLAEICLHARRVREQFPRVSQLRIAVLAFEAYSDPGFSLAIPQIDRQGRGLVALAGRNGETERICAWLEEKAGAHANFDSEGLEELLNGCREWDDCPPQAEERLGHAIEVLRALRELRIAHTEGPQLDAARQTFRSDLGIVIRALGGMAAS